MTESSCWYLVWLAGSKEPFCPIIGGKVIDMGVVGVEGAGGRDGVFEGRCCVFEGVLDLLALPYSFPPTLVRDVPAAARSCC